MKTRALVIGALVVSLAACGSSKSSSSASGSGSTTTTSKSTSATISSDSVKPCELLTQDEVQAAYGGTLATGQANNTVTPTCIWSGTSTTAIGDNVQIQVQQTVIFDGTQKAASSNLLPSGTTVESVSGIGDSAFYQVSGTSSAHLVLLGFKKKGVAIYVSMMKKGASDDQLKTAEKQLAQEAAGRL